MKPFGAVLDDFFYRPDEEVPKLPELEETPEPGTHGTPVEEPVEFLLFALDAERYGVPLSTVREIVRVPWLTEIPRGAKNLLGVMNLRGQVLPVYDVKQRLGLSEKVPVLAGPDAGVARLPKSGRIIVVRHEEGDLGVLVDAVTEVVRLRPSALEPPPAGAGDCRIGVGRKRDQLFAVLDLIQAVDGA